MSRCISDMSSVRIQFTPDLMPKEISGAKVIDPVSRETTIEWGPIVGRNFVVADEINRGKTNVQSALLEAMGEGQVTVGGKTKKMENPFIVMATQNPIEQEGTNPLPEAQHDRFLFKETFDYVSFDDELMLLEHPELADGSVYERIVGRMSKDEVLATREFIKNNMRVSKLFNSYLLKVCRTTRPDKPEFNDFIKANSKHAELLKLVKVGVGPRALQGLQKASLVQAFLFGTTKDGQPRLYVKPADLKAMAHSVLRHRIIMKDEASYLKTGAVTSDEVIKAILDNTTFIEDESQYDVKS
jgi:MoxR-like ATPase